MFFEVIPTEIFRNGGSVLTYHSDQKLLPGQLVIIPLGPRNIIGIVWKKVKKVNFPTKPITRVLFPTPIPSHLLKSIIWLAEYYLAPVPAVANMALPAGLASRNAFKDIPAPDLTPTPLQSQNHQIPLNSAQKTALKALQQAPEGTSLLQGVTGSGKTNIYLKMAENALLAQKSTILLVPEIALTSQLVKIFEKTFGKRVILMHSNQTLVERRQTWLNLLKTTCGTGLRLPVLRNSSLEELSQVTTENAGRATPATAGWRDDRSSNEKFPKTDKCESVPQVIIGPRSALFAPVGNLGLIIIDESHESAYYQENTPHYSALRLASFISKTLKIPCIQGTATPNIIDFHLASTHNSLVPLTTKAKSTAIEPHFHIVDLKDRANFCKNRYFSDILLTNIEKTIKDKHQTLIFHNRRGSSPLTICEECGWQALCPECYLPMTLHADGYILTCHICGHEEKVPSSCPNCQHPGIVHKGFGTKLLESELTRFFPHATIARFDGDNQKGSSLAHLYQDVKSGKIDILIGTQTLARGLDLPYLATVGIVQADSGLSLPDFSAEERTFELLTQVIGRVGRGHLDQATAIIQTFQPDHPVIQTALESDFETFSRYLIKKRRAQNLPPFAYLARLAITYKTEKTAIKKIQEVHSALCQNPKLQISPPMPAFHERTARGYTWQITLKSPSRETLRQALLPYTKYQIELDPPSLL